MKKALLLVGLIGLITFINQGSLLSEKNKTSFYESESTPSIVQNNIHAQSPSSSVFVPYWALQGSIEDEFDRYYYFGIAANIHGIDTAEQGYKNLSIFLQLVPQNKEKYLVIRMVDSSTNSAILRDGNAQRKIVQDSIKIARDYGFDGIVLDFELSALAFESVIKEINTFVGLFSKTAKQSDMPFLITVYGDTFYRLRPYDITTLGKEADGIMIMTYDLHKAKGNPGPNFPLFGKNIYGYDMEDMINDFKEVVPAQKITVILGQFGYDWTLDEKNNSIGVAKSYTLNQIKKEFLSSCPHKDCVIQRDTNSKETQITYTDKEGKKHSLWFEDKESLEEKKRFLKEKGINSISLWAHSFF